jgi:hypothetical protein
MPNKSKGWTDVQLIISSFSVALTLGFWGLFASHEKSGAGVSGEVSFQPQSQPDQVVSSPPFLLPGQKLYLNGLTPSTPQVSGTIPQQPPVVAVPKKRHGGGGGGGPATSTRSSHP